MKNLIKKFVKENKGASEVTQSFLLIGVAIALVLTVFFPNVKKAFNTTTVGLESWLSTTAAEMFDIEIPE